MKEKQVDISTEDNLLSKVRGRFAAVSQSGYAFTATSNGSIIQTPLSKAGVDLKEVVYRIQEVKGFPVESSFRILRPFTSFQLSRKPDGTEHFVFTLSGQRRIMIVQVPSGLLSVSFEVHLLGSHSVPVTCTAISNEEELLVSSSSDGCIKVWDLASGGETASVEQAHDGRVSALAFGFRYNIVSGGEDGTVSLWAIDATTKTLVKLQHFEIPIGVMPISSVGASTMIAERGEPRQPGEKLMSALWIGAGAEDGSIYVWSANQPEEKWELAMSHQFARSAPIKCLCFNPVRQTLLVSGWSAVKSPAVHIYSIPSFDCIGESETKSCALSIHPRSSMKVTICQENLRVETFSVSKTAAVEEKAEESPPETKPPQDVSETITTEDADLETAGESKSTDESEDIQVRGHVMNEVNSPGPFPRKMPQEIQALINKLKSNSVNSVPAGPQPRQVPQAVIEEVCSTSSPSAGVVVTKHSGGADRKEEQQKTSEAIEDGNLSKNEVRAKPKKPRRRKGKKSRLPKSNDAFAQPRLCSTAMLKDKIDSLENEAFDPPELLEVQCREKAVRKAMADSNLMVPKKISALYNGLEPIVDQVPDRKLRKVGKQVDPSWAQTIKIKPKLEDCWKRSERVPQVRLILLSSNPSFSA